MIDLAAHPGKFIITSENAAAVSSRGTYVFPVYPGISAPVSDSTGGDPVNQYVSAYELYTAPFGSSADKVFGSLARHPYVGGPNYYGARSSYFGVIDLAGFPRTGSTCTSRTGGPIIRCRTNCRTGATVFNGLALAAGPGTGRSNRTYGETARSLWKVTK